MRLPVAIVLVLASLASAQSVLLQRVPDGGIQPQAVIDSSGIIHLIYLKGPDRAADIYYTRSKDAAKSWSAPIRVTTDDTTAVAIGTIRGPRLALGKNNRPHIAWMGSSTAQPKFNNRYAPMLYTRLADDGASFERPRNVIVNHPGLDGGGTITADNAGHVYIVWHAPAAVSDPSESSRRIYIAASDDDGKTFAPETDASSPAGGACGCCNLAAFIDKDSLLVLYRTATESVHRDMRLLTINTKPALACADYRVVGEWTIGKCVMSTASFTRGDDATVYSAWESEDHVYFSALNRPPTQGPKGKHPNLAINRNHRILLAWTNPKGFDKSGRLGYQLFNPSGEPLAPPEQPGDVPAFSTAAPLALPDNSFLILY